MKIETTRVCECCGRICNIDSGNLKSYEIEYENKKYKILYFECEQCKTKNIVQIDNDETTRILNTITSLIMSKKDRKRIDTLRNVLEKKRRKLMSEYKKNFVNNLEIFKKNGLTFFS